MLRRLLERVTRRSVLRRHLPREFGSAPILVSGSAGLKFLAHSMDVVDPPLYAAAAELVHPGAVVWDVGANIGLFTFASAHLAGDAGQIVAIDADLWLVDLLRRSAALQPASSAPVTVVPCAVARRPALRTFNLARRSRATHFLDGYGSTQTGGVKSSEAVVAVSLDWLAEELPRPDLVKIDVEGAELEVLEGATALLRNFRPRIICEVSAEMSIPVGALLNDAGYAVFDGDISPASREPLVRAPWNTIAVAKEGVD